MLNKMIEELIKEEASALKDFDSIKNSVPKLDEINFSNFEMISKPSFRNIFKDLIERSGLALKECQLIESLDKQLRRLNETQIFLKKLTRLNQLNELILSDCKDLANLIEMILEWRQFSDELKTSSEKSELVKEYIEKRVPEIIDESIGRILKGWTDEPDKIDQQTVVLLSNQIHLDPSCNPLHGLFSTYPSSELKALLHYHLKLGNSKRVLQMFPERLLNRFYDILHGKRTVAPFSVGLIEEMVPEKMKYASRISCILEATAIFLILHEDLKTVLLDKCGQIAKQIRKCAREERKWGDEKDSSTSTSVSVLDAQLNEISLIAETMKDFLRLHPETSGIFDALIRERDKWMNIYSEIEAVYLKRGIKQAIEMDQIVTNNEFPVSSCVDDIFYVLQAAKKRSARILIDPLAFIAQAFNDHFLLVLKKHLTAAMSQVNPLQSLNQSFKPSRELISALVLVNNLVATRSYWRKFTSSNEAEAVKAVNEELDKIFEWALREGLYLRLLQVPIRKEFNACKTIEALFSKLQSIISTINSLFNVILCIKSIII